MRPRHPRLLPLVWLFTDERQGSAVFDAVRALPPGSGIVFRHYSLPPAERAALFARIRRLARRRRLCLLWAGSVHDAVRYRADGVHGWDRAATMRPLLRTAAVHDRRQLVRARRIGADVVFLSPLFATRSHPGARPLGRSRFGLIAAHATMPVIALGGVSRNPRLAGAAGFAAIDGLTPDQKRKAVPR